VKHARGCRRESRSAPVAYLEGALRQAGAAVLVAVALVACGGERRASAPQPITRADLAAMIPRTRDFPREVRELPPLEYEVSRGWVTNAEAIEQTPAPDDTAADLARMGRRGGYQHLVATVTSFGGLAWAEAAVDVFRSEEEADRFIADQFSDLRAQEGKEMPEPRISHVSPTFVPHGLGAATGVRYTLLFGDGEMLHVEVVGFRVGRVAGWTIVARADEVDPGPLAEELARTLRDRIRAVQA
jgi:hypothetical protein